MVDPECVTCVAVPRIHAAGESEDPATSGYTSQQPYKTYTKDCRVIVWGGGPTSQVLYFQNKPKMISHNLNRLVNFFLVLQSERL